MFKNQLIYYMKALYKNYFIFQVVRKKILFVHTLAVQISHFGL